MEYPSCSSLARAHLSPGRINYYHSSGPGFQDGTPADISSWA